VAADDDGFIRVFKTASSRPARGRRFSCCWSVRP